MQLSQKLLCGFDENVGMLFQFIGSVTLMLIPIKEENYLSHFVLEKKHYVGMSSDIYRLISFTLGLVIDITKLHTLMAV